MLDLKMWIFRFSRLYQHLLSGAVRLMHWLQLHSCRTIVLPTSYQTVELSVLSVASCAVTHRHFFQRNKCQTEEMPVCFLTASCVCKPLRPTSSTSVHGHHLQRKISGLGGLEVACWPLVPKFAGSNSAEAVGFFRAKKSSARLPSEGK